MQLSPVARQLPALLRAHFPQAALGHALTTIGYGSAIFPQTKQPVHNTVDLIMVVRSVSAFHQQMLNSKPGDYSGLPRYLGVPYLDMLGKWVFPVHFNHTSVQRTTIKYAIVSEQTFLTDLNKWNLLTFAGRLHKPVYFNILDQPQPAQLSAAVRDNYRRGLGVGLLSLIGKIRNGNPETITLARLYASIVELSYLGDIRYTVPVQNTNKITNIVNNNLEAFKHVYEPVLRDLSRSVRPGTLEREGPDTLKIRYTPELIGKLCSSQYLPEDMMKRLADIKTPYSGIAEHFLMNGIAELPKEITSQLVKTNRKSSTLMAVQNFLGASLINNMRYLLKKISKKNLK